MTRFAFPAACRLLLAGAMLASAAAPAFAQDYRDAPPPPRYQAQYQPPYEPEYRPEDRPDYRQAPQPDGYDRAYDRGGEWNRAPAREEGRERGRDEDDIVVFGRTGRLPDDADSVSTRISYHDLDLYYPEDRRELRRRISATARYLCDKLGESDGYDPIGGSCRDTAERDALQRVGTIEAHWIPRGTYLVR